MSEAREEGFVLVTTIWFVALLGLVAAIAAGWVYHSLHRAETLQQRFAARTEILNATSEVVYLLVTGYYSPRGLELGNSDALAGQLMPNTLAYALSQRSPYIALDNRPYRFGKEILRLQDDHGLLNLNFPSRALLGDALYNYGVPYNDQAALIDQLLDYTDRPGLIHLNGSTEADYLAAGSSPPREAPLLTPWELHRVLGWNAYPRLWRGPDPFSAITTVRAIAGLNLNTAPAPVLRAIPGIGRRAVARLLRYRASRPIVSWGDIERAAGGQLAVSPMDFVFVPADSLRLTITARGDPLAHIRAIRLTPTAAAPFRVDYAVERPLTEAERAAFADKHLPALPATFASR